MADSLERAKRTGKRLASFAGVLASIVAVVSFVLGFFWFKLLVHMLGAALRDIATISAVLVTLL